MSSQFKRVPYTDLDPKQQENYNFMKVSAVLADYGFVTMRLSSDWQFADFIAQHIDGIEFLKVQLKGRFWLDKKYFGKGLHIAFPSGGDWYVYPHDELLTEILAMTNLSRTPYWQKNGVHHRGALSQELYKLLMPYKVPKS